jgi:hypothetical protein
MSAIRGSAHTRDAGLSPIEPSDEFVRPADLKKDQSPNRPSSLGGRVLRAVAKFLVTVCVFLAAVLAWRSYGNIARQMTADVYRQLGWLGLTWQKAPNATALIAPAAPFSDQQQLDEVLPELHAMGQSIGRIAARQEQITRRIDQIATSIIVGQELTRSTDETGSNTAPASAADAARIMVESRADEASLQPTERFDKKPTEARSPQTLSEKGKSSCFPSASAVLQNHRGGWPTWTLRAPGHEGTLCWYAAARPRGSDHRPRASDHRREMMPGKEIVGITESGLSAPPARADPWAGGLQ